MKLNQDEIAICSASDVDTTLLIDFYQKAYPDRIDALKSNWNWLNRSEFYESKTPLVLVYKNQVIAHAGMIPFNISVFGNLQTASWFIDFKVLPEFQRHGLGMILTKEWMTFSDCCVTFCNDKSIGVFKKYGWFESFDTYMHLNFTMPFNHPRFVRRLPAFVRKILNLITCPILFRIYIRHSYANNSYQLERLSEESFSTFLSLYNNTKRMSENMVSPIKDLDYCKWRVLRSPNRDKYFIYKTEALSALVSLQSNQAKYIDILWMSNTKDQHEIIKMVSTLGIYGIRNGFSYVRFYTSNKQLSDHVRAKTKSIVRHPRFAYFCEDESIMKKLKRAKWDFELIDSDFEDVK